MRRSVFALPLFLVACSNPAERDHYRLMQDIERRLKLPSGTATLQSYARYYTIEDGRVVGIYITIVDPKNQYYDLPKGQSRWVEDHRNLPGISDGGCAVVTVIYDPKNHSAPTTFCNGVA